MRAVILAIGLLAVASVSLALAPASAQKRLENVRVCGVSALDRRAGVCTKDESGKPIVSSQLNCSARARGEAGERFAGRFLYRGQPFPAFGTSLTEKRKGVYIFLTAGPNPMPGGAWSCELQVGPERARKSFRSGDIENGCRGAAARNTPPFRWPRARCRIRVRADPRSGCTRGGGPPWRAGPGTFCPPAF